MDLFLIRHGEAYSDAERFERPLNERGIEEVSLMASYLASKEIRINRIYHSHKLRSIETAEIIANSLGMMDKLALLDSLSPDADIYELIGEVHNINESSILVGHLPNLALLSSFFLTGDIHNPRLSFATASCALFEHEDILWSLKWSLEPSSLRKRS